MKKILMSLALAAVSAIAFAAQPSADDAKALVEQQAKTVFTKLNANQSRYRNDPGAFSDLIKSEVLPYMDFELMSQVVLGRHWRDASAQQKADFTAAFRDLLVRVYSRGWTKQATVVFSVRYKGGQWKIYDVSFENVSILSSYRNSFDTEINQGGIDKLIAKIKTMKGNE